VDMMGRLKAAGIRPELVYAWADESVLLRRYTETRRRHPLAPRGRVTDGIAQEEWLTAELKEVADWVVDTSDLAPRALRQLIEQQFAPGTGAIGRPGLSVCLVSFAFPRGLPREADLVFDARFLRNPHYDPILRPRTGLDEEVGLFVEADPDYAAFFGSITSLLALVLPRFVQEGKKYSTIAVGCTGGRHRSVYLVEKIGAYLRKGGWRLDIVHRELARENAAARDGDEVPESHEGGSDEPPPFRHRRPAITL